MDYLLHLAYYVDIRIPLLFFTDIMIQTRLRLDVFSACLLIMFREVLLRRGCSAVVARSLRMWKAPGSIPGISISLYAGEPTQ